MAISNGTDCEGNFKIVEHISAISAGCVMLDLSREEIFWAIFVLTQLGQIAETLIFLSQPLFFIVWHNPIKANFEEE